MTTPGLFSAPFTSSAPVEPGRFAPPVVVEVSRVVTLRSHGASAVRRHGLSLARTATAAVAILVVAAALAATAISYGALTLGSARMTTEGTMIPPLPTSLPMNALPAGTMVTATPGDPVKVGIARLLQPALAHTAQLMIVGPISQGVGLAGYATRCIAGGCTVGDAVTVKLDEIAGGADSGVPPWQWFTAGTQSG